MTTLLGIKPQIITISTCQGPDICGYSVIRYGHLKDPYRPTAGERAREVSFKLGFQASCFERKLFDEKVDQLAAVKAELLKLKQAAFVVLHYALMLSVATEAPFANCFPATQPASDKDPATAGSLPSIASDRMNTYVTVLWIQ